MIILKMKQIREGGGILQKDESWAILAPLIQSSWKRRRKDFFFFLSSLPSIGSCFHERARLILDPCFVQHVLLGLGRVWEWMSRDLLSCLPTCQSIPTMPIDPLSYGLQRQCNFIKSKKCVAAIKTISALGFIYLFLNTTSNSFL